MPEDFASPDRYPYELDGDKAVIVPMDRAAYHRSIFLDRRISPASEAIEVVAIGDIVLPPLRAPAWIFHIAHCGSTLLARALDDPTGEIVLREPLVLRQLGVSAARGHSNPWLLQYVRSLGRGYFVSGRPIVKANVPVNMIVPDLMDVDPLAPAIFLYFPLAGYLTAILRSPNHRQWVRNITDEVRPALEAKAGPLGSSDAERAAGLWLAQLRVFAAALDRYPNARSLDADALFNTPRPVLAAAYALFERSVSDAALDAIIAGPLFSTYSKNPAHAFDNAMRLTRADAMATTLAPEVAAARAWVAERLTGYPLPEHLAQPLVGKAPALLAPGH